MSIFDALKGRTGGQGATSGNPTLDLIGGLIQKSGGIGGLVSTLQQGGLGGVVESWVGNGTNQPVNGQQLGQALAGTPAGQHVEAMA
ncbi:MAG: YidB family protein [Rhodanobacteraceae bacterium]